MHIKQHTNDLIELIKYANRDQTLEFEMIIKEQFEKNITNEMFNNVVSRIKGSKDIKLHEKMEMLDISFKTDEFENIRVTILGQENITNYCLTNDIKSIDATYVKYISKTPIRYVNVNDYNIKFNLKRENELNPKDESIRNLNRAWSRLDKFFRYKKRMSYITSDNLFMFDLTVLKTSNKKTLRTDNKIYKRKDLKDYMKKYIVKPPYVTDLNSWFNDLNPNDEVELIGKKYESMISSKTLQKSNVFDNSQSFEIELEYIGNKVKAKNDPKATLIKMLQNTILILQAIQKSYYLISETEKKEVIENYKELMGDYRFKGPQNVTLELKHVIERKYEEYDESFNNIRRGFTITDKADGERNLLIILENGSMYLMNRKNTIKSIGAKCEPLGNTILDCEYIIKNKENKNINLLMVFDIYYKNSKDLRERILNRSNEEKMEGKIDESRFEVLDDVMEILDKSMVLQSNNNLEIRKKKFFYGDESNIDPETITVISELESKKNTFDPESDEYNKVVEQITTLKRDSKIFDEAKKVYEKEYPYKIDGLVFTPRSLRVGEEPNREKKNMFDGRWYNCFKWKPPDENTIDFLVKFKKDPENESKDLITYKTIQDKVVEFKTLVLHVGYNPQIHTRYNSCRILNENLTFENSYSPAIFQPIKPYIKDIHYAYLPVVNGQVYTNDKTIILEDNIVEFNYIKDEVVCWNPLRVRDTLKPNDFVTATNVWDSIHNPVTLKMITSGVVDAKLDLYYFINKKRGERKSKSLNDFHSFVKKDLIMTNMNGENNVLDLGVGKGGDLNHYIEAKINVLVGIDSIHDNLNNSDNGLCNRIFSKSIDNRESNLLTNSLIIWGNCEKNILNADAGNDDLNKYYLDIIYGNLTLDSINNSKLRQFYNVGNVSAGFGFDVVSSQFAFHYFFKNIETLDNCLKNISKSLKPNGRFIGTCLDGKKVFDKLSVSDNIGINDLWTIKKKYDQTVFPNNDSSLGYVVNIFNESIGISIDEYLVNFDYLIEKAKTYNLELVEINSFSTLFDKLSSIKDYGSMKKMTPELKEYSFLNNSFVFQKK
jgi:SAM-dependent methyltransferase